MTSKKHKPFNPLVLDPDDYEKLFDDEFVPIERLEESDGEFDYLSNGGRRRKPQTSTEF